MSRRQFLPVPKLPVRPSLIAEDRRDSCSFNCRAKRYRVIANGRRHQARTGKDLLCENTPKTSANGTSLKWSCGRGERFVCYMHYLSQLVKEEAKPWEKLSRRRKEDIKESSSCKEDVHHVWKCPNVSKCKQSYWHSVMYSPCGGSARDSSGDEWKTVFPFCVCVCVFFLLLHKFIIIQFTYKWNQIIWSNFNESFEQKFKGVLILIHFESHDHSC